MRQCISASPRPPRGSCRRVTLRSHDCSFVQPTSTTDGLALRSSVGVAYGAAQARRLRRSESRVSVREDLAVLDADSLEEPLLAEREGDEVPELDELRLGEVRVQPAPEIGDGV